MFSDMASPAFQSRSGDGAPRKDLLAFSGHGIVSSIFARNDGGSDVYLQVHDVATTPENDAVPAYPAFLVPAGNTYVSDDTPRSLSNGCYIAASTTAATLTLITDDTF